MDKIQLDNLKSFSFDKLLDFSEKLLQQNNHDREIKIEDFDEVMAILNEKAGKFDALDNAIKSKDELDTLKSILNTLSEARNSIKFGINQYSLLRVREILRSLPDHEILRGPLLDDDEHIEDMLVTGSENNNVLFVLERKIERRPAYELLNLWEIRYEGWTFSSEEHCYFRVVDTPVLNPRIKLDSSLKNRFDRLVRKLPNYLNERIRKLDSRINELLALISPVKNKLLNELGGIQAKEWKNRSLWEIKDGLRAKLTERRTEKVVKLRSEKKKLLQQHKVLIPSLKIEEALLLPFEVFPAGSWVPNELIMRFRNKGIYLKEKDLAKWEIIIKTFKPDRLAVSRQNSVGYDGYLVFIFDEEHKVIAENPFYGNATYIIKGSWEEIVEVLQLSRSAVRSYQNSRFVIHHTQNQWIEELKREFRYL